MKIWTQQTSTASDIHEHHHRHSIDNMWQTITEVDNTDRPLGQQCSQALDSRISKVIWRTLKPTRSMTSWPSFARMNLEGQIPKDSANWSGQHPILQEISNEPFGIGKLKGFHKVERPCSKKGGHFNLTESNRFNLFEYCVKQQGWIKEEIVKDKLHTNNSWSLIDHPGNTDE